MTIRLHVAARQTGARAAIAAELAELIADGYRVTATPGDDPPAHVLVVGPEADRLVTAARALAPNVVEVRPSPATWADWTDPSRRWPAPRRR